MKDLVAEIDQKFKSKNQVPVTSIRLTVEEWNEIRQKLVLKKLDVDRVAQAIRAVDGNHTLGAGELAERLLEELRRKAIDAIDCSDEHEK